MNLQKSLTKVEVETLQRVKNDNQLLDIQVYKFDYAGHFLITLVKNENSQNLQDSWKAVNSSLSQYLVDKMNDDFSRWNLYLLFLLGTPIDKTLQYEIENNTFSSRKIVIPNFHDEINDESAQLLISDHIDFSFVITPITEPEEYTSTSDLWQNYTDGEEYNNEQLDAILHTIERGFNEIQED